MYLYLFYFSNALELILKPNLKFTYFLIKINQNFSLKLKSKLLKIELDIFIQKSPTQEHKEKMDTKAFVS